MHRVLAKLGQVRSFRGRSLVGLKGGGAKREIEKMSCPDKIFVFPL